jgi:hypothetical protein
VLDSPQGLRSKAKIQAAINSQTCQSTKKSQTFDKEQLSGDMYGGLFDNSTYLPTYCEYFTAGDIAFG